MGLFDNVPLVGQKKYKVKVKCTNCNKKGFKDVPKGVKAKEYFETSEGVCNNCGLNTIAEEK